MPTDIRKVKETVSPIYTNDPKLVSDYQERMRLYNTYEPFLNAVKASKHTQKERELVANLQRANLQIGAKELRANPIKEEIIYTESKQPYRIWQYEKPKQEYVFQKGKYRVSYYDTELKRWNEKDFMTQKESDEFTKEISKRRLMSPEGNITQYVERNNKK